MKTFLRTFVAVLLALVVFTVLCGFALTKYRSLAISNSTIDSTTIGATTPSTGTFTTLTTTNAVTLGGRLTENAGVVNTGTGFKHVRVGSCLTSAGAGAFCQTIVTWPTPFADTNYTVVCSVGPGTLFLGAINNKTTTSITPIVELTPGNSAAASTELDCIGIHD